ncbi:unnamed protein product [Bubo scandiacus]
MARQEGLNRRCADEAMHLRLLGELLRLSYGLPLRQNHHQKEHGDPDRAAKQTCSGPGPRLQGVPEPVNPAGGQQ